MNARGFLEKSLIILSEFSPILNVQIPLKSFSLVSLSTNWTVVQSLYGVQRNFEELERFLTDLEYPDSFEIHLAQAHVVLIGQLSRLCTPYIYMLTC